MNIMLVSARAYQRDWIEKAIGARKKTILGQFRDRGLHYQYYGIIWEQ